ncbi:MAG: APC family permease [Gemmatimonadaceae bacterium]
MTPGPERGAAGGGEGGATPGSAGSRRSLVRAVGTWALAASIFNVTVGGGIFVIPAIAAKMLGPAAPIAYLVCGAAIGLIVLCFAEAGSRISRTGGPYAYVEVVFGPYAGFLAGVLLWMMGTLAMAGVATMLATNLAGFAPALGSPGARALLLIVLFAALTWVNVRGVSQGTRLISVASVAKLLPLLLLIAFALPAVKMANVAIPAMPSTSALSRASIVLIFAFLGVESALVPSGEIRDPSRTVPRALAIAMTGVVLLYVALQLVVQGVLGPTLGDPANAGTPLAAAAGVALGGWGRTLLLAGATVSMFGYVSGMTLAIPRALFAFAEDRILPSGLAAVHPRYHTPWIAIIVQSALVCGLAIISRFEQLAVIANLASLLLYLGCIVAAWELRRRGVRADGGKAPLRLPFGPLVHLLAAAVIVFMLSSITRREWSMVAAVLLVASLLFALSRTLGAAPRRTAIVGSGAGEAP